MIAIDDSLRQRCLDNLTVVMSRTPLVSDPLPHFVVRGFFPDDVYDLLLQLLPQVSLYEPFACISRKIASTRLVGSRTSPAASTLTSFNP
jgi:hypothetical protein